MKRLYRTVEVAAGGGAGEWRILLDGRGARTPGRRDLSLPSRPFADAVAAEWRAQGERIAPATMPLSRIANNALDRVATLREIVIDEIAAYAETDLLCYRAAAPAALRARQDACWQPVLDWIAARHGAGFVATAGVIPVAQPPAAVAAVRRALAAYPDLALAALHLATAASGSVLLALALAEGRLDQAAVVAASQLDESHQAGQWGADAEAEARRAALAADIAAAARALELLRE